MENISIDQLHERVNNLGKDDLILDVRGAGEFESGHIKGARNTPHDQVDSIAGELRNYKTVYVHCKMGGRAKMASQTLRDAGLNNIVCVGEGGMHRWAEKGWPMES
ncbi:MAG: rhodanese-like domain-containing protein [Nitrospinae bacterium]|nr:rhodanese-like domain-containing protein [Nitrospinota bacterium]